jgi:hypothetical protein
MMLLSRIFDINKSLRCFRTISFSVDIDQSARQLISLLEKTISFQKQSTVLKQMIQRYYRFLQLKASQPENTLLIPTLDIELVWQTHLLRPEMYRKDCLRLFRRVIDHEKPFSFTEADIILDLKWCDQCKIFMNNALENKKE